MKKSLAILILLSMILFLLSSTVLASMPAAVTEKDAGVRVELAAGEVFYFDTLTPDLFLWLSTEVETDSTVTVLRDLFLSNKEGTHFLSLGQAAGEVQAIVLDLNGYSISYEGPSNLFSIPYDGDLTVKNGTIFYQCVGNTRAVFALGSTSSQQCDPNDETVAITPKLHLDHLKVYGTNPETGRIINCFQWMAEITIDDSFLWTTAVKSVAIDMRKSTQKDSETVLWRGKYKASVSLNHSIVGTAGSYVLGSADECKYTIANTTLVSTFAIKDPTTPGTVIGLGEATSKVWNGEAPDGSSLQGTGVTYSGDELKTESSGGIVPGGSEPPTTGVSIGWLLISVAISTACFLGMFPKKKIG